MAHLLGAERVGIAFPTRVVFEQISLGLEDGDRIGIVGRNGDGKSTLLRMLAGKLEPTSGRVTRRSGLQIGVLDQRDTLDGDTTIGESIVGDRPEYEWAGDARIRDILNGLVGDLDWHARVGDLSGGQRRRVALAQLLAGDWDVLFLDEPTNHLDVQGIAWLADHLNARYVGGRGAFVAVTHDRWFLDAVCTGTWEVHDQLVEPFDGGYAAYILQRVERDRMAAASESKRQNLMKKELAWLRRGAPARTAKPKFRIDAANQLIEDEPPARDPIQLAQLAATRLGKDVVDVLDASVELGGRTILDDVTWRIAPGERAGILGRNGAGKSTLLALIAGRIRPTSGRVKTGKTVKIAELTQELAELAEHENDPVRVVVSQLKSSYETGGKELTPGQLLERLGFRTGELSTLVKDLSGGQRRRLQLLLILLDEPNVLILDEPTNDLDTDMLAAMEDVLDSWAGCLIVVSHDRYLIERVTDHQFAIVDGGLRHMPGGVDAYLALSGKGSVARTAARATQPQHASGAAPEASAAGAAAPSALSGAERRALEKEAASLDRRLEKSAKERESVLERFETVDHSDFDALAALQAQLAALDERLASLEEAWLEAHEGLEG
ncbi:ABC-F family ATP-binding cassette domain-containing protein [Agrococcus sp. ARC_14]|uniref:ABC-F family ATP-binding cassette domain-containing protein n=1 Tax=Agrococcus sp. ARC_14 TaxID=2919927 RepID=UPI001F053CC0|nr:ABC-F family ATP-binding cassette domain-containing protein [Agrococcus sp. ARC_14]MCH1883847.1 ATP-binding cassette domain-containing protein [Agrococcus sp. ARC_14]